MGSRDPRPDPCRRRRRPERVLPAVGAVGRRPLGELHQLPGAAALPVAGEELLLAGRADRRHGRRRPLAGSLAGNRGPAGPADRLHRAALPFRMDRTPEAAWPNFHSWRINYESVAYAL